MTKTVIAFVLNPRRGPQFLYDQYDSYRGEGRHIINTGLGLSLLGFDVNLINGEWTTQNDKLLSKQIFPNVTISNKPIYQHYDYLLAWDIGSLNLISFDKAIFMDWLFCYINNVHQFISEKKKDVRYIIVLKKLIDYRKRIDKILDPIEVNYMPVLFPVPSINIGFIPFNIYNEPESINNFSKDHFDKNKELRIYIYASNNTYIAKQKLIIDTLKNEGYKIKLQIHADSNTPIFDAYDNIYLYNQHARYIDVINFIRSANMCISYGTPITTPILVDVLSLGKPIIYISDSHITSEQQPCFNDIYDNPEELIYIDENDNVSIEKILRFSQNPKDSYDKFKNSHKDIDFNNWKEHAKKYFVP